MKKMLCDECKKECKGEFFKSTLVDIRDSKWKHDYHVIISIKHMQNSSISYSELCEKCFNKITKVGFKQIFKL